MRRSLTMTAIAALCAGPAFADGVNYARLSYDFTKFDADSVETELGLLQGGIEYQTGQFLFTGDALNITADVDAGGVGDSDTSSSAYAIAAGYMFTPEVLAGAGVLIADEEGDAEDTEGFELFGQYQTAEFGVGLNVAKFDADEDNVTTSLYGEFVATPGVTLAGFVITESEFDGSDFNLSADYEDGAIAVRAFYNDSTEDDEGVFGVRGHYEFTPQLRASASYATNLGDDLPDGSVFAIGGGYQIVDGLWVDANYGIVDSDEVSGDIDRIQASLTYELGDRKRIDRRLEQDAIDDLQVGAGLGFSF
ncbi:hypothetical protein [Yoonia sp. R2-816]|uniref:hypothetical protein n=1 Tax=Yoonia sp. R2-816 TaxID=3342638 RepID=UPI00372C0927